ncbi:TlpA family protein disulfide reductase [Bacteroidota bacterium]
MKKIIKLFIFLLIVSTIKTSFSQVLLPADTNTLDSIKKVNKGNVILFNFWASWCKPCKEEFPDLVKIHNDFKDKNFSLIFVSLDFDEALENNTIPFLKEQGVDFTTYFNNFEKDEDLILYIDKNWNGGIPGTFIFDKEGKLSASLIGAQSYATFEKEINKQLNK